MMCGEIGSVRPSIFLTFSIAAYPVCFLDWSSPLAEETRELTGVCILHSCLYVIPENERGR